MVEKYPAVNFDHIKQLSANNYLDRSPNELLAKLRARAGRCTPHLTANLPHRTTGHPLMGMSVYVRLDWTLPLIENPICASSLERSSSHLGTRSRD